MWRSYVSSINIYVQCFVFPVARRRYQDDSSGKQNVALLAHLFKIPQSLSGNCGHELELRNYGYCSFYNSYITKSLLISLISSNNKCKY